MQSGVNPFLGRGRVVLSVEGQLLGFWGDDMQGVSGPAFLDPAGFGVFGIVVDRGFTNVLCLVDLLRLHGRHHQRFFHQLPVATADVRVSTGQGDVHMIGAHMA